VADRGAALPPLAALGALLPASLYGEGLARAFDRLSRTQGRRRSLRGRTGALAVVLVTPALLLAGVGAQEGTRARPARACRDGCSGSTWRSSWSGSP
jgi:hypothetical protein